MPPDFAHLAKIVEGRPWVLACGLPALKAVLSVWDGPLCAMPHPAYRVLTSKLLDEVRMWMTHHANNRMRVEQKRGFAEWTKLDG